MVERLRLAEQSVNHVEDGRSSCGARQTDNRKARILVRRIVGDVRKVEIPRHDRQLVGLSVGGNVLVRCAAQADSVNVGSQVSVRLNQRRAATRQ